MTKRSSRFLLAVSSATLTLLLLSAVQMTSFYVHATTARLAGAEAESPSQDPPPKAAKAQRTPSKAQPRASNTKVKVDPSRVVVDDGDTVTIRWGEGDEEIVRILGIDTPETQHVEHNIPLDQPYGREARAFAQGAFAVASEIELLRCATLDPYGRTLGYLFLDGKNYSLLAIRARLAEESVTPFGDNGFPEIAAEVLAASRAAGPLPFESPNLFRKRMRPLSEWTRGHPEGR